MNLPSLVTAPDQPMTWAEFTRHIEAQGVEADDAVWLLWDGSVVANSQIEWDGEVWSITSASFTEM